MSDQTWWNRPRQITCVVDNDSWILPYVESFVTWINKNGDKASLIRLHKDIPQGDIAFYLGCVKITPPGTLALNHKNIVVHASDLPQGRGFAPVAWQILEGKNQVPFCLIEADEGADTGPIIYREVLQLEGTELCDEWRDLQGKKVIELCQRYLQSPEMPEAISQTGEGSIFARRKPEDSVLDPNKTLAEQFELLRVVDNNRYPAFFDYRGQRYKVIIEKMK